MTPTVQSLQSDVDSFIFENGGLPVNPKKLKKLQLKAMRKTNIVSDARELVERGFSNDLIFSIVEFASENK